MYELWFTSSFALWFPSYFVKCWTRISDEKFWWQQKAFLFLLLWIRGEGGEDWKTCLEYKLNILQFPPFFLWNLEQNPSLQNKQQHQSKNSNRYIWPVLALAFYIKLLESACPSVHPLVGVKISAASYI